MVFELTQNYQITIAVMLAVVVAAQVTHGVVGNTFFGLQLEQRGVRVVLGGKANGDFVLFGAGTPRQVS